MLGSDVSGTWARVTSTTTAATGRFNRKIQRHDAASTRYPPRNGPTAVAIPPSADHAPMALPRSAGTKLAWMMARLPGVRRAPPTPWSTRAATSSSVLGAMPQRRDAAANHTTPTRKTLLRP
jgi:hypothetical protein